VDKEKQAVREIAGKIATDCLWNKDVKEITAETNEHVIIGWRENDNCSHTIVRHK